MKLIKLRKNLIDGYFSEYINSKDIVKIKFSMF